MEGLLLSREPYYLGILEATAVMQDNIALMLEAKAVEAEKSKNWICCQLSQSSFPNQEALLKAPIEIHEKVIEVIGGLVRMEQALGANLKVLIGEREEESDGDFDFGQMFGQDEEK
jgi:hypothetical protein